MRVRCLHMNDAHIYCTKEQFAQEFRAVNDMYLKYFKIFGIDKYVMRLSLHDPAKLGQKYINEPELWMETEEMVRKVLIETNIPYVEVQDEALFTDPKLMYRYGVPLAENLPWQPTRLILHRAAVLNLVLPIKIISLKCH